MAHRIASVEAGSIAEQCGLRPGDILRAINGEPILDQIDYQFFSSREALVLEVVSGGETVEISLEKDADEPLGLTFEDTFMAKPRECVNHCIFCFIDQMPPGLRDTLYVKDDDWRLSLMMGNYITLTNISEKELQRVIARRASPLYISVHATDGDVRQRMMRNPRAADILDRLRRLADAGIAFHCQVVLCPGYNDGAVLDDTIRTLASLYPATRSIAVVPVGLTGCRESLTPLTPFDQASADAALRQITVWQERLLAEIGSRLVFAADELYCLSGRPVPEDAAYEGYPQIENGVGMLRSLAREFEAAYAWAAPEEIVPRRVIIATGTSAAPFLSELLDRHPLSGVEAQVLPVANRFFGNSVTVAGLLTGQDLLEALKGRSADEILIPQSMLRYEGDLFLDNMSRASLEASLGIPVHAAGCDGAELFYALAGELYRAEEANG